MIVSIFAVSVWAYNANGIGGNPAIMGHSAEEISGLPNFTKMDYVIESWTSPDGSAWYRKYKSGWIEQGGYAAGGYVTFPLQFVNTNYGFQASPESHTSNDRTSFGWSGKSKEGITVWFAIDYSSSSARFMWEAKGY